jgi:hypothetical protein
MALDTVTQEAPPVAVPLRPFSAFDIALHNIRENLISKYDMIDETAIEDEVLKEIITLSIALPPLPAAPLDKRYIEFPVAGCWREEEPKKTRGEEGPKITKMRHWYSGELPDSELLSMPPEVQSIRTHVRKALMRVRDLGLEEGIFGKEKRSAFKGHPAQYPESLRRINGFWRVEVELDGSGGRGKYVFIILYKHKPPYTNKRRPKYIDKSELSQIRTDLERFLKDGLLYFFGRLLADEPKSGRQAERGEAVPKTLASDVPILEDIVSRIQEEVSRLKRPRRHDESGRRERDFKRVFSVVFVRTALNTDGRLSFRYIFTDEQRQYLKNTRHDSIEKLVARKRVRVLEKLNGKFHLGWPGREIKDFQTLGEAINLMAGRFKPGDASPDNLELEELLRTSITTYYAFHPETEGAFRKGLESSTEGCLGLADVIESEENWVTSRQAFLITQVMRAKNSDVVTDFINHPFSKYVQHPTPQFLELFRKDFFLPDGGAFYPRVLHLFEMLFFPRRFFMYPIYQYSDVPLLMCAFDADEYHETRSSLKGIVDRYVPAIFGGILAYHISETTKRFASVVKRVDGQQMVPISPGGAKKHYLRVLRWRVKHLLRLFCRDMGCVGAPRPRGGCWGAAADPSGSAGGRKSPCLRNGRRQDTRLRQQGAPQDWRQHHLRGRAGGATRRRHLHQVEERETPFKALPRTLCGHLPAVLRKHRPRAGDREGQALLGRRPRGQEQPLAALFAEERL